MVLTKGALKQIFSNLEKSRNEKVSSNIIFIGLLPNNVFSKSY